MTGTTRAWAARRRARTVQRILMLGVSPLAAQLAAEIERRPGCRCAVVGVLDDTPPPAGRLAACYLGPLRRLATAVQTIRPHRIVVGLWDRDRIPVPALLNAHIAHDVIVEDAADFYEWLTGKVAFEALTPMRAVAVGRDRPSSKRLAIAGVLTRLAAAAVLLLAAPLMALIALAIKLDSTGPVLFAQPRVGLRGRSFTLLKFRTMHNRPGRSEWECDNRDRVTRTGRWLRAFRLDELPQFFNIVRGDMSLIGPRPHPASNFELFTLVGRNLVERTGAPINCYALRSLVRPGLTGWAQVRYQYANNLDEEIEKLRYDLYYVKHRSIGLNLRILFETIRTIFGGFAYGRKLRAVPGPAVVASVPPTSAVPVTARPERAIRAASHRPMVGLAAGIGVLMLWSAGVAHAQTRNNASPAPVGPPPTSAPAVADRQYEISIDDVIEVSVWDNTALTRTVRVRPDGRISLPLLNDLPAAGLTPMALQNSVTHALEPFIKGTPQVSVILQEIHKREISVIGEVKAPGRYALTNALTVLDALAMAGGLTEYADKGGIVILRRDGDKTTRIPFAYEVLLSGKDWHDGRENLLVRPDDIIVVR